MNDTVTILKLCRERGVSLEVDGDDIFIEPISQVYDLIEDIRYLKFHLISALERAQRIGASEFEYERFYPR